MKNKGATKNTKDTTSDTKDFLLSVAFGLVSGWILWSIAGIMGALN